MAKKTAPSRQDNLQTLQSSGIEQVMPGTHRKVKLRQVSVEELVRENKMPDILTPLIISAVYTDLGGRHIQDYLSQDRGSVEGATQLLDSINFIVSKALVDPKQLSELTLPEKKWIFQLVLGPAEFLANFRLEQEPDVESVAEGEDVQQASE